MQKTYLPVRGCKVPRFMRGSIGPTMEICETLCLPIPMVPRLHKSNGYIKRKLRIWRAQKCIALVCAQNVPTTALLYNIRFQGVQHMTKDENMRNFVPTNLHGTAFVPKQWLYQKEAICMESSKMHCPRRYRKRTYKCWAVKYPIS